MRLPKIFNRGEKQIKFDHPTKWEDVTLKEFCDYSALKEHEKHIPEILEIFTGIEADNWRSQTRNTVEVAFSCLGWIYSASTPKELTDAENAEKYMPKYVYINEKYTKIPDDIINPAWAAIEDINNGIEAHKGPIEEILPNILACLLFEAYTRGSYHSDKVEKIVSDVGKIPAIQAMPILYFFFKKNREKMLHGWNAWTELTKQPKQRQG